MSASAPATKQGAGKRTRNEPHAVKCWYVDLVGCREALREVERTTPRLSDWDRENAARFADAAAGTEWLTAHIALRILVERAAGPRWRNVPLERAPHAKPCLPGVPVVFSVSHVAGLALIALGPGEPLGIDVERTRSVHMRSDRRARIEVAAAACNDEALPDLGDARFLQAWVRLEALAKAQGCGIGRLLTRLGLTSGSSLTEDAVAACARELRETVRVYDLLLGEGLFGAVATGPAIVKPEVFPLPTSTAGLIALLE